MQVRLQKFIAEAGVASRRAAERLIFNGYVEVNGKVVKELGTKVDPLHDTVKVEGRPLKSKRKIYVALHKPRGVLSTRAQRRDVATVCRGGAWRRVENCRRAGVKEHNGSRTHRENFVAEAAAVQSIDRPKPRTQQRG